MNKKRSLVLARYLFVMIGALGASEIARAYSAEATVTINAPLKKVWEFNSVDDHAKNWSVFFAKIVRCPDSVCPENVGKKSGEIGSIRRCFRNGDEAGLYWDELTLASELQDEKAYRKIISYNIHGYDWKPAEDQIEMIVEQFYKQIGPQKTALTFRTTLRPYDELTVHNDSVPENDLSRMNYQIFSIIFRLLSGPRTVEIFDQNLENIKAAIETGESYKRVFAYRKFCDPEKWYCSEKMSDY